MSKKKAEDSRAGRAAAIRQQQARRDRNRNIGIGAALLLLISAFVAAAVLFSGGDKTATTASSAPKAVADGQALVVGNNPNAKTKVVVFEDFLCPFCRQFEASSRSFLRDDARKGKVLVEYRPFQLIQDDYSKRALNAWAAVLEHGTPAQALKLHDLLYDKQPYEQNPNKPDDRQIAAWVKSVGADSSAVTKALGSENQTFYAAAEASAREANITGTPTILVNGQVLKGGSVTDLADNLQKMIASAG